MFISMRSLPAIVGIVAALAAGPAAAGSTQPVRKFDFSKVGKLLSRNLSPTERTKLGITYLREEISRPTGSYQGLGGPIDHPYVVAQLVLAIAQPGADRDLLWQELQRSAAGEYRDALALTLGLAGDQRAVRYLVSYIQDTRHHPDLRERAARALGEIGDPSSIPVLVTVLLNDPVYQVQRADSAPESPVVRSYPVRRAAKEALRYMESKGVDLGSSARTALGRAMIKVPVEAGANR